MVEAVESAVPEAEEPTVVAVMSPVLAAPWQFSPFVQQATLFEESVEQYVPIAQRSPAVEQQR